MESSKGGDLGLSEEDRRALRGSKFGPLPSLPRSTSRPQPRLAHPGGPLKTNKAAALAKFLQRKLQDPNGLSSLNPDLIELAVKNAKVTVNASGRKIRHVTSFRDPEISLEEDEKQENSEPKKQKKKNKKNKKKKNKKLKTVDDDCNAEVKMPQKL